MHPIQGATRREDRIKRADGGGSEGQLHAHTTGRLPRDVGGAPRCRKKVNLNLDIQPRFAVTQGGRSRPRWSNRFGG